MRTDKAAAKTYVNTTANAAMSNKTPECRIVGWDACRFITTTKTVDINTINTAINKIGKILV